MMKRKLALIMAVVLLVSAIAICPVIVNARAARGDATNDGSIDMKDVLIIRKYMASLVSSGIDTEAADVNGDHSVDMKDVLMIRKYMAGFPVEFAPYDEESSTTSTTQPSQSTSTVDPTTEPNLIPDQITLNYYDNKAEDVACTWHIYKTGSTQVLQYMEKPSSGAYDFSNAKEVTAKQTKYSTLGMEYDIFTNTFVFASPAKLTEYCEQAVMDDLKPATTYCYRVGDKSKGIWSDVGTFTTQDPTSNKFSFVNITDTQVSSQSATDIYKYTNNALSGSLTIDSSPDFILHNGDIVQRSQWLHQWRNYLNGSKQYYMNYPVAPVTGNHDSTYDTAGEYELIKHFFIDYPESNDATNYGIYYSFDYANAHFIILNTDNFDHSNGAIDETQLKWLENDLKANTKQWTIVAMHRPMVCVRDKIDPVPSRDQLLNLFNEYGVDLVIQGHEHAYEHTYPIGKDEAVQKNAATRTENGTKYYVNPEGVMFVTCATSGSDGKAPLDGINESFYETFSKGQAQSWGNFSIDGNKLTIGVYYYSGGVRSYTNNQFGIIKE